MPLRHLLPLACVSLLAASGLAGATAQRTFVSGSGVDNPGCSLASPCRSFSAAITATSAGGEVIVLDSAGYGAVTITKSVSIIAPSGIYGGISVFSGNGVTINAPGATVVLRGLSINGQGGANGILAQAADRVRIESCVVSNMAGVGIYHQADNAEMIVLDTISRDNGDGGLALVAIDASIVLDHVRSEHNANVGFYIAPVASINGHANATITESTFVRNGSYGIWADSVGGADTRIVVERSVFSGIYGFYGTAAATNARVLATLTRNAFNGDNPQAVRVLGYPPGAAYTWLSENTFGYSSSASEYGAASHLYASGNTNVWLVCGDGALLSSLGNNFGGGWDTVYCGTSTVGGGY